MNCCSRDTYRKIWCRRRGRGVYAPNDYNWPLKYKTQTPLPLLILNGKGIFGHAYNTHRGLIQKIKGGGGNEIGGLTPHACCISHAHVAGMSMCWPILYLDIRVKHVKYMTTVVYQGGLGVLPQKILKIYSSNGAFWDIPEQNLRRITGKLKKPTLGKNRTLNVERRSMCIIDKKEFRDWCQTGFIQCSLHCSVEDIWFPCESP